MKIKNSYSQPQVRLILELQSANPLCISQPDRYIGNGWDDDFEDE